MSEPGIDVIVTAVKTEAKGVLSSSEGVAIMIVRALLLALISMSIAWVFPTVAQEQRYDAPEYQVGDWYLTESDGKKFKLVIGKIDEKGLLYFYVGKTLANVTTGDLNTISERYFLDGSWQRQTFSPHKPYYAFPLYVGKKWSAEPRWKVGAYTGSNQISAHVVSLDSVMIGEKTLQALRIDYEERVIRSDGRGPLTKFTCWYVPAMKYPAKCGSASAPSSIFNVVDYGLKSDSATSTLGQVTATTGSGHWLIGVWQGEISDYQDRTNGPVRTLNVVSVAPDGTGTGAWTVAAPGTNFTTTKLNVSGEAVTVITSANSRVELKRIGDQLKGAFTLSNGKSYPVELKRLPL